MYEHIFTTKRQFSGKNIESKVALVIINYCLCQSQKKKISCLKKTAGFGDYLHSKSNLQSAISITIKYDVSYGFDNIEHGRNR